MLTLFHAPLSRSTRMVQLLREMGIEDRVTVQRCDIPRRDGSGGRDAANPHPEGKVPVLLHDGALVTESNAIMLYLTDLFPEAGMGPVVGDPARGSYLTWLAWYGNVLEPVVALSVAGIEDPSLRRSFRGMEEALDRLEQALATGDYLMGDRFTAVDILVSSAFTWAPDSRPASPAISAWIDRCIGRPAMASVTQEDMQAMGYA